MTDKATSTALAHLKKSDPVMAGLIHIHGPSLVSDIIKKKNNPFHILVRTIINQQLSIKAGQTIVMRVLKKQGGRVFNAEKLQKIKDPAIRGCGVSTNKLRYIRTISQAVIDRELDFRILKTLDDDAVVNTLTQYPGIGPWTAELFLISALNRLDVLPLGDLILRKSMQQHYQLDSDCDEHIYRKIAEAWRPYRTIASRYLWS